MIISGRLLRSYAALVGVASASAAGVACLGYWPTVRFAGEDTVGSMLVGCGVSWLASCIGAIPLARALSERSALTVSAILASTAIRFVTVLLLVAPLALSGWVDRVVLVLWVAVSYMVLLMVDTAFAVHGIKRLIENDS